MALIEKLLEWRLDCLIREFDIDIENFYYATPTSEQNWLLLGEKIIPRDYITTGKNIGHICLLLIHNIIWKNIIKYELKENTGKTEWHMHMLYNNVRTRDTLIDSGLTMNRNYLLGYHICRNCYCTNCRKCTNKKKIENLIINYLMLIDPIIIEYLLADLSNIIKMYMIDAIITI